MTKQDLSCETPRQLKPEAAPEKDRGRHCSQTRQTPDGSQTTTACTPALTKCLGKPLSLPRSEGASARRERVHI